MSDIVFVPTLTEAVQHAMKCFREQNPNASEDEELEYFISVMKGSVPNAKDA